MNYRREPKEGDEIENVPLTFGGRTFGFHIPPEINLFTAPSLSTSIIFSAVSEHWFPTSDRGHSCRTVDETFPVVAEM
jgi:hypothetical protein